MMKSLTIILICSLFAFSLDCCADSPADKCFDDLKNIPDIEAIASKISFPDISKATFEQLANQDKPTPYEKTLIAKLATARKICSDMFIRDMPSDLYPPIKKANKDYQEIANLSYVNLYNLKISYGEFLTVRQQSFSLRNESIQLAEKELEQYNKQVEANNAQIEALQRARNAQSWANAFGGMADGIRNSMPPRAVTCVPTGFGVRCQ
jgi:hypothetical protein